MIKMYEITRLLIVFILLLPIAVHTIPNQAHAQQIPNWFDKVIDYYNEGYLSDIEMLDAINYTVSNKIISENYGKYLVSQVTGKTTISYAFFDFTPVKEKQRLYDAFDRAVEILEEHNNGKLDFVLEENEENADVIIHWKLLAPHNWIGLAEHSYTYSGDITIGLASYDCRNSYVYFDDDSLTDTIMHELVHILGVDHVDDPSHLMYSHDDGIPLDEFDTNGFIIPSSLISDGNYYLGQKELETEMDDLELELNAIDDRIEILDKELEDLLAKYGYTMNDWNHNNINSNNAISEGNKIVYKLQDEYEIYNMKVEEFNEKSDLFNCYTRS